MLKVKDEYLVLLSTFTDFGPLRLRLLIDYFKSTKNVWNARKKDLLEVGLPSALVEKFVKHRQEVQPQSFFDLLDKKQIKVLCIEEDIYPSNLKKIEDAPLVLYYKGQPSKKDDFSIGIVGARKMTSYGKEVTSMFASQLASMGISIVSGLAFGVDMEAHRSAIEMGGRCVAVLASGVDQITPRTNQWLGDKIIKEGGVIYSEYPPGTTPQKNFFPYRNRIISGISRAIVVVEGMAKSGTLHTATHAASQGKTVFAVPGQITSPTSQAPHFLIKNGAKITTCVKDILDELDMEVKVDRDLVEEMLPESEEEKRILEVLESEPLYLDEVARIIESDVSKTSSILMSMQLKGLVKDIGGGMYRKTKN